MGWFILTQLFSTLISLVRLGCMSDSEKDLEILILRHQLHILERKQNRTIKPHRAEKLILAALTAQLKKATNRPASQLRDVIRIFQPETVLRWHRELVRRKWTFRRKAQGGRPRISRELEALIVRLARENSRWGYGKIEGELLKLGCTVSASTVRNVLNRHGMRPAPVRHGAIGYYNTARPHQGLAQQSPIPRLLLHDSGPVRRREVLGGIIGDYYRTPDDTGFTLG